MDSIRAEVIAIGDELTSGARLDTNSQWISRRLGELGIPVSFHTTVGDDLDANIAVFRTAMSRADVVVVTGGLGPTEDDLTRSALARATGTKLALDQQALDTIRSRFANRKRGMPPSNERQAMFPVGSRSIENPHGTAPGIAFSATGPSGRSCHLFALPGVPAELFEMWEASVADLIARVRSNPRLLRQHYIKCFGVGESRLEEMLPHLIARDRTPRVGITVHQGTITLRITATGRDERACNQLIEPTVATVRQCLGKLVFGEEEDDELQHAVLRLLDRRQATVATAECGTAGQIATWLAEASPRGKCYLGGVVIRSSNFAGSLLGDACSKPDAGDGPELRQLVRRLSLACRHRTGADYVLATGPLADTDAGTGHPFTVAVATPREVIIQSFQGVRHPSLRRVLPAKEALNVLRLQLLAEQ